MGIGRPCCSIEQLEIDLPARFAYKVNSNSLIARDDRFRANNKQIFPMTHGQKICMTIRKTGDLIIAKRVRLYPNYFVRIYAEKGDLGRIDTASGKISDSSH